MGKTAWKLFGQQAAGLGAFYLAYLLSGFLPMAANISFAIIVGIGAFIGYIVCNAKNFLDGLWLFPVLFSVATGFAVGIYFCAYESLFFGNWATFAVAAGISFLNALLLFADTGGGVALWRKIACTLVAAGTLALSVVCFCNRNGDGAFVFREAAFVFLFLFALLTGECFYIWLGGDVRHKTNLAFCAAFFVVLFIVLLIVTEGDAADGIGDVFVGGVGDGSKTRKRRKKPKKRG